MNPVMTPRQGRKGEARPVAADAPPGLNTTLYNVMATLQTVVEPGEDNLDRTGDRAGSPPGPCFLKYSRPAADCACTDRVTLHGILVCSRGREVGCAERPMPNGLICHVCRKPIDWSRDSYVLTCP
jgi:hypothetical protein